MTEDYDGKVIHVFSPTKVVINMGSEKDVEEGDRFMIFVYGPELHDPETRESLGRLEIVKGKGRAIHIQDKMATIETDERVRSKKVIRRTPPTLASIAGLMNPMGGSEEIIEEGPPKEFYDVNEEDLVRNIS